MGVPSLFEPAAHALAGVLSTAEMRAVSPLPLGVIRSRAALLPALPFRDAWRLAGLAIRTDGGRAAKVLGAAGVGELGVAMPVVAGPAAVPVVGDKVTAVDVVVRVVDADARAARGLLHTGRSVGGHLNLALRCWAIDPRPRSLVVGTNWLLADSVAGSLGSDHFRQFLLFVRQQLGQIVGRDDPDEFIIVGTDRQPTDAVLAHRFSGLVKAGVRADRT